MAEAVGNGIQEAPLDRFRRSAGFQFGFVMYSGLEVAKAIDHLCASAEKYGAALREWQPIETAPKDGTYVLLWLSGDGYHGPRNCNITVGVHTDSGWYYIADGAGGKTSDEPSHWMPLPDPPS